MAKAFHNLAGVCRDLRAAVGLASEGNQEAADILDAFNDALGLLDAWVDGDLDGGEGSDEPAPGDTPESEGDASDRSGPSERGVVGVGARGERPTLRSTRAGMRQAAQAARLPVGVQAFPAGLPRAVEPARARARGER